MLRFIEKESGICTIIRTWIAEDAAGNVAESKQVVTVLSQPVQVGGMMISLNWFFVFLIFIPKCFEKIELKKYILIKKNFLMFVCILIFKMSLCSLTDILKFRSLRKSF